MAGHAWATGLRMTKNRTILNTNRALKMKISGDFGTVRPVGGRGAGLRPMNDSATNARASADSSKQSFDPGETVKAPPSPQKSTCQSSVWECTATNVAY